MDASRLQVSIGMFLLLSMLAIGWPPPAAADTYTNVSATAMWFGGGSWPDHPVVAPDGNFETGLGADEIFNATFQWDVTTQMLVAGSVHTSFTGPIGPFVGAQILPWFANFYDASGDYVQFFAQDFSAI